MISIVNIYNSSFRCNNNNNNNNIGSNVWKYSVIDIELKFLVYIKNGQVLVTEIIPQLSCTLCTF
jgi:hypothetical protein